MNRTRKHLIENALETIAIKEGITTEEVRAEIGKAVAIALKSTDPKVQHFWNSVPCVGDSPTVDEVIDHLALVLSSEQEKGQDC